MFCPYCGSNVEADGRFCSRCGRQLPSRKAEPVVQSSVPFQASHVPAAAEAKLRHGAPVPEPESVLAEGRSALAYYVPGFIWCGFWILLWLNWSLTPPSLKQIPMIGERLAGEAERSDAWRAAVGAALPYVRIAFLLLAAYAAWRLVRWFLIYRNRYYIFTTQRIKMQEGVLTKRTRQIELFRLKDLAITQSLLGQAFNYANLRFISTDRLARDEMLPAVFNGPVIADAVRNAAQRTRADSGVMQISE